MRAANDAPRSVARATSRQRFHRLYCNLALAVVALLLVSVGGCKRHESEKKSPVAQQQKHSDDDKNVKAGDKPGRADNAVDDDTEGDEPPESSPERRLAKGEIWNKGKPRNVRAAWYDVPEDSLAARRAGEEELTAAHNQLPIGTLVRVTRLSNGRSVIVRITDRGIHDPHVKLDLCKEAAERLDMVSKGIAKVRLQVLDESGAAAQPRGASSP